MASRIRLLSCVALIFGSSILRADEAAGDKPQASDANGPVKKAAQAGLLPTLFSKYCLDCHSAAKKKGELDLERFRTPADLASDLQVWRNVIELVEAKEMPPKDSPPPTDSERGELLSWTRTLLHREVSAHAGDPGRVVLRRLSHAEYTNTIRDLTGIDIEPARDFPADGAAGEGFTNAGDGLVMSSVLLGKYLTAAKEIAAHAVLLPDGFRFSPSKTRRDRTDEAIARLRAAYADLDRGLDGGRPAMARYLRAALIHRQELHDGKMPPADIAERENLNGRYFAILWQILAAPTDAAPHGAPIDGLRQRWNAARPEDADDLATDIREWQSLLFKFSKIGSYQSMVWQDAREPSFVQSQPEHLPLKIAPGQTEVTLFLATRGPTHGRGNRLAVWRAPRFEGGPHPPISLRDVAELADRYDLDYRAHFAATAEYLQAALTLAQAPPEDRAATAAALAERENLHPRFLERWVELLALPSAGAEPAPIDAGKIPPDSALGQWRAAALAPERRAQLEALAAGVRTLLGGDRPRQEGTPNRQLYDALVTLDSPLFAGIDLARWPKPNQPKPDQPKPNQPKPDQPSPPEPAKATSAPLVEAPRFGVDAARFEDGLTCAGSSVIEIRVPAALFQGRQFMATGELRDPNERFCVVQFVASAEKPQSDTIDPDRPAVASADVRAGIRGGAEGGIPSDVHAGAPEGLRQGWQTFRENFPIHVHYPKIVPDDEIICLRLYFREDDAYFRLCLNDAQRTRLDALWRELRCVSEWPLVECENYESVYAFASQTYTPAQLKEFDDLTHEPVKRRAAEFAKEQLSYTPAQLDALADFASRAMRHAREPREAARLKELYAELRAKNLSHEEAFRLLLVETLVSPAFLYRCEQAAPGAQSQPVSAQELATRLSYFLWASMPDAELRAAGADGRLLDSAVLAAQTKRMLRDARTRGFASEFGAQWLHVRGVTNNHEKNEKLFPEFDDELRQSLLEEPVRFFQYLVREDRSVLDILNADHTFVNERLARHYGIPGVAGSEWRRVDNARSWGRGGVLGFGGVLAQQSGASRNSPVLRGNWVVEVLLGERIPKPPANVPRLPEEEGAESLSVRQMTEKHARVAECAVCHERFDPYGFALEKYDPIGRLRERDLAGRPIDTAVALKNGTRFDGLDGLRNYLLSQRQSQFLEHFCRKLLGYALGRTVIASDQPLVDAMVAELASHDFRISAALNTIVASRQFRHHRGLDATTAE